MTTIPARLLTLGSVILGVLATPCAAQAPDSTPAPGTCHAQNGLPDPACTPGAVMTRDLHVICGTSTSGRRNVTEGQKRRVRIAYGASQHPPVGSFEIDHLVSLELGGSNSVLNLWPEPAAPKPGFHEKDQVENELHREVCAGTLSLDSAVHVIATNWLAVYRRLHP